MKNYFFLLMYPRSRSTWFSQFLTTKVTSCYHEILSGNDNSAFYKHMEPIDSLYIGSADTNVVSFGKTPRLRGPIAVILRKKNEVKKSLKKAFLPHPAFNKKEWEKYINSMISMYEIGLNWYIEKDPDVKVFDFKELEDPKILMRIWEHLIPGHRPTWDYIKHMNGLSITVKRKEGLTTGIDQTCRNIGITIEDFKKRHLDDYDPVKFKEDFYREPEPEDKPLLYLGNATKLAMA